MIHKLPDGRDLGYAEYGDLSGFPVFFFHGTAGSKLFHPPLDVTQHMGVRLICAERPGYGESTFQPNRRILDWPKDVVSLADALKLDRFAVSGHSGGGPHTLACAYALADRVTSAAVVAGAGPVDTPNVTEGLTFEHSLGYRIGQYTPWPAWYLLFKWLFRDIAADPSTAIDRDQDTWPPTDKAILTTPEIHELCVRSDIEAFRQGLRAFAWDARLLTRPWGFNLSEIKVPVHLWHGTADNSTTLAMAKYMAEKIPNGNLVICEGEAHMLLIPHWGEILAALIQTPISA